MRYMITLAVAATPAFAEVPQVVTDIPPVHALVAQVMGDLGQPDLLLAPGADEHDFQLRPSQAALIAEADLVVWIGPDLTPWLDSAMEVRPEGAAALALLSAPGTQLRAVADPAHETDDDHDHDHDHDGDDPHVWLDPDNARLWVPMIAEELARLDPDNAQTYRANAAAASKTLDALDAEIAALLAPVQSKPFVTFHDAYGYFADHYGLAYAGSIALGDASTPGAQRLDEIRSALLAGDAVCIFPEAQHDPALVDQMAEGTMTRIGPPLDPVGSTVPPGPGAYGAILKGMAQSLAGCLAG